MAEPRRAARQHALGRRRSSRRLERFARCRRRGLPGRSTTRRGRAIGRWLAEAPTPHVPARLRRHAPRARRPSGSRRADHRDPRAAARPRLAPATTVHVVSGRTRETLDAWFGDLPIYLCAEHGYLVAPGGRRVAEPLDVDLSLAPARRAAASGGSPRTSRERSSSGRPRASPGTIARPSPSTGSGGPGSCWSRSRRCSPGISGRGSPRPPRDRGQRPRRQQGRVPRARPGRRLRRTRGSSSRRATT